MQLVQFLKHQTEFNVETCRIFTIVRTRFLNVRIKCHLYHFFKYDMYVYNVYIHIYITQLGWIDLYLCFLNFNIETHKKIFWDVTQPDVSQNQKEQIIDAPYYYTNRQTTHRGSYWYNYFIEHMSYIIKYTYIIILIVVSVIQKAIKRENIQKFNFYRTN